MIANHPDAGGSPFVASKVLSTPNDQGAAATLWRFELFNGLVMAGERGEGLHPQRENAVIVDQSFLARTEDQLATSRDQSSIQSSIDTVVP